MFAYDGFLMLEREISFYIFSNWAAGVLLNQILKQQPFQIVTYAQWIITAPLK